MRKPPVFDQHPTSFEDARNFGYLRAQVPHVVDGDTFDVFVDLGLGKYAYEPIRLVGPGGAEFDAPEIFHPSAPAELQHGFEARNRVADLIEEKYVLVKTYRDRMTFGRYVANVLYYDKGKLAGDLADLLTAEGLAKRGSYA